MEGLNLMPQLNISLVGEANSSASGMVTDANVLLQIKSVMRHLQDRAQVDPPAPANTANTETSK